MKRYRCAICGHVYDPQAGEARKRIPAGTPFDRLPEAWSCPDCGGAREDFVPVEDEA